jgi:hypothetical protein
MCALCLASHTLCWPMYVGAVVLHAHVIVPPACSPPFTCECTHMMSVLDPAFFLAAFIYCMRFQRARAGVSILAFVLPLVSFSHLEITGWLSM